jgi:hypothetical protein
VALTACDFNKDGCMDLLVGYAGKYRQIDILYGKVINARKPTSPEPEEPEDAGSTAGR